MDQRRFTDFRPSLRRRARSQPRMSEYSTYYERSQPRYHEQLDYHERPNYSSAEEERPGRRSFNYYSEPEVSFSSDDESGFHEDFREIPKYSPRMRRNASKPNLNMEYDSFIGRGRSRTRRPMVVEQPWEEDFTYRPRSVSRGRSRNYPAYDEFPYTSAPRSWSRRRFSAETHHRPAFFESFHEEPSFRETSNERIYEIPSFAELHPGLGSEEHISRGRYESAHDFQQWKEPIKFRSYDELLKPVEWRAKLETLEAQVLHHSSFREFSRHMEPLELDRFFLHIAHADKVIYKVVMNLKRMRDANYCLDTFNILVIEKQRLNVARLVGISRKDVTTFSLKVVRFLSREGDLSLYQARTFLAACYDFLLAMELDLSVFQDSYQYLSAEGIWYTHFRTMEGILSAILYSTRAIAYLLDIATVSFCGAHLEPFDEVYFDRVSPTSHFRIPCDAHGAVIDLRPRNFQCLEGFLQGRSVWVFSTGDSADLLVNEPLYLSTTPGEFENVWGPMWKSVDSHDSEIALRYMVSPGFIVPWRGTRGRPALFPNEVHCHWTKDSYDFDNIFAQNVHGRVERLLIGAPLNLILNRSCRPSKQAFYNIMSARMALKDLGFEHGGWTIGPVNVSAAFNTSALLPVGITTTFGTTITKKPQKSLRELLCTAAIASPREIVIQYLNEYCGVEISACTGNARRIRFCKVLGSETMNQYLRYRIPWSYSDRQDYFQALRRPDSKPALNSLYRHGSEKQKKNYDAALKLSIAALAETRVKGSQLRALWAWEGKAYTISFKVSDHRWAGLLTDTLTTCSLVIITQTCLECSKKATRHHPGVPIGKPTVLETGLVINPEARLPLGLNVLRTRPEGLSEGQIFNRLQEGDTFDIRDHGRVRVLRTPSDMTGRCLGVYVELIKTFVPAGRQSVRNFFLKVRGRDQLDAFHREYKDIGRDHDQSWFYIFVVSDPRHLGPWQV